MAYENLDNVRQRLLTDRSINSCVLLIDIKRYIKYLVCLVIGSILTILLIMLLCNYFARSNSEGRLYTDIDSIPKYEVGLLLGTTPQTRIGKRANQFFKNRIDATEYLYKAGKSSQY